MASRKKQEDKHLQILRELVGQQNNKKCFDCGQRGPTYVNMTIGAYVCTSCSGLLRGLNPPHRIKSISMATFSSSEIDFLQKHGNEVCRNTWLALWDSNHPAEPESREEQKVKDFLIKKYERKTWYSNHPKQKQIPQSVPEAKPLKQLLGENSTEASSSSQVVNQAAQPQQQKMQAHHEQPPKSKFDLLGDLGNDPFASNNKQQNQNQEFTVFGGAQQQNLFGQSSATSQFTNQQPFGNQPSSVASQQQKDPFGSNTQSAAFSSNAQPSSLSAHQSFDDSSNFFGAASSAASFDAFGTNPAAIPSGNSQTIDGGFDFYGNAFGTNPAAVPSGNSQTTNESFDFYGNTSDVDKSTVQSSTFNAFGTSNISNQGVMQADLDKYKALSELDDVFRSSNTQSVFSSTSSGTNASRDSNTNQQPNPFMSPASGTSGIAMFQQQQQKAPNPFQPGAMQPQNQLVQVSALQKNPQQFSQSNFVSAQSSFGMNQGFAGVGQSGFTNNQLSYGGGPAGFVSSQASNIQANQMNFGNQQAFNPTKNAFGQMMPQQGQFTGQPQQGFGGQNQGFGAQQQMYNPQQSSFNGPQNAFGTQQNMSGQQFGTAQQGFGGQQLAAFQTANTGMQNQIPGRMQGQMQGQMPGQMSGQMQGQMQSHVQGQMQSGFSGQQQQQQFGTWGQSVNKGVGTFGMGGMQAGMAQKSTNPFM